MSNTENLTTARQEAREEEMVTTQLASDKAFFDANPLSFEFDYASEEAWDQLTAEQTLEFRLRALAHLFHQAATDVLLVSKFPGNQHDLTGRAYRHAALALAELNGLFKDADHQLKQRLGAAA
jgi:hypothetical protein